MALLHNQLVAEIETLCKLQSTRNQRTEGLPLLRICHQALLELPNREQSKVHKSLSLSDIQHSENSELHRAPKAPREDIEEIVRKRIKEANQHFRKEGKPCGLRTFDSSLSEEITSHRFPKKFVMPSFECYSGATDSIQHLCQY